MKYYTVQFKIEVIEGQDSYAPPKPISLSISEKLPANVCPHKYIRSRVAEELTRNFGQLSTPIENRDEESLAAVDPLSDF